MNLIRYHELKRMISENKRCAHELRLNNSQGTAPSVLIAISELRILMAVYTCLDHYLCTTGLKGL